MSTIQCICGSAQQSLHWRSMGNGQYCRKPLAGTQRRRFTGGKAVLAEWQPQQQLCNHSSKSYPLATSHMHRLQQQLPSQLQTLGCQSTAWAAILLLVCGPAMAAAECTSSTSPLPWAELAGLLNFGADDRDPIDPFTLYGSTFKRYSIEKLDGEKIVSRRRGFTVTSCVAGLKAAQETPQIQGLPISDKVRAAGGSESCSQVEGPELRPACVKSCQTACSSGFESYAATNQQLTGYAIDDTNRGRVVRSCQRQCLYECEKPGKGSDFVIPYRR